MAILRLFFHRFSTGLIFVRSVRGMSISYVIFLFPCSGFDVIAQVQSGTGKTTTFSTSILQTIDNIVRGGNGRYGQCKALVFAPTRQLAQQVRAFLISFYSTFFSCQGLNSANLSCDFLKCNVWVRNIPEKTALKSNLRT